MISRIGRKVSGHGPRWTKPLRWLLFLGVVGVLCGVLAFFVLYQMIDIPDANADFQTETTTVYYSDGEHVIGTFATQDRDSIDGSEMPDTIKNAVVAAEDRTFYTNRGIDLKGILRAARNNATTDTTQGASTITQQYVKILYLTQKRTLTRKIKEAILSIKIHNQVSKQEILEGYLNTIYFGNGAYGIEVAAQTYFDEPAKDLTVPQAAVLASVLNNPTYYDPYSENGKKHLIPRYNYVLKGMVKMGTLDAAKAEKYYDNLPEFVEQESGNVLGGPKGYVMSTVKRRLKHLEFSDQQINGGGLKVVTTIGYEAQKNVIASVKKTAPDGLKKLRIGVVAIEPGTSAVRAFYGGEDYVENQLNWALIGSQPGSTFKTFAVAAALDNGFSLRTRLNGNSPYTFPNGDQVENEGRGRGISYGYIPLSTALAKSVNTAFMDLTVKMDHGPKKIRKAAAAAGLPESVMKRIDPVRVVALGYARVPTIDMANAYATYANGGKSAEWYMIESVHGRHKRELYKHKVHEEQTVSEDVAADVTSVLQDVVKRGTGTNAQTQCPTAGKTGTATAGVGQSQYVSSSWFIGYTPKLVTAVMYARGDGNDSLEGYLEPFFGARYPATTFHNFMVPTLKGTECGTFPPAANIESYQGKVYTPPPPECASDEQLNQARTACEPKPPPECAYNEQLNDDESACVPRPPPECGDGETLNGDQTMCIPAPTPTPPKPTGPKPPGQCVPSTGPCPPPNTDGGGNGNGGGNGGDNDDGGGGGLLGLGG